MLRLILGLGSPIELLADLQKEFGVTGQCIEVLFRQRYPYILEKAEKDLPF